MAQKYMGCVEIYLIFLLLKSGNIIDGQETNWIQVKYCHVKVISQNDAIFQIGMFDNYKRVYYGMLCHVLLQT